MSTRIEILAAKVDAQFGDRVRRGSSTCGELTYEVMADDLLNVCRVLRDESALKFEQLVDLTGIDYSEYGRVEWRTQASTATGFSRGVDPAALEAPVPAEQSRFAVIYHLLSLTHNVRLRLRCYCSKGEPPLIDSVNDIWASANWFEREAFDLFGILFKGHPDLRRILTDYGFIGHPFRKDFPLIGNVEVRYDPDKGRVVYQPVSIEPRTLVPRVIRDDNRYEPALKPLANTVAK
ncbi:MAG: NADH-quinone oxidoreductase subunit C [Candidatus Obscuribacterales bacterium]|nr:NADH-quinone oxidoreductase subunit C [Steroidobacteraceae bacterium]